jgi:flagellar motility protein MotE (MotC chaperone)
VNPLLTNEQVEQIKKPNAGITISRKISTGQYENAEVEAWATTGTLDSDEVDELEERLEEAGDKVFDQVHKRIQEIQDCEAQLTDKQEDKLDDALRMMKAGRSEDAANLLKDVLDNQS